MAVTNDQLTASIASLKTTLDTFTALFPAWASGVAGGGPNNDGKYPLPNSLGATTLTACPAQMAVDAQTLVVQTGKVISLGLTSGYTAEGNNVYTFKPSDSGKLFMLVSNNNAANNPITLKLPPSLPNGWNVVCLQYGLSTLRFQRSDDTTDQYLRNRQKYFKTAGQGSLIMAVAESNGYFTIGGDVGP